ncbi:MAG: FtsW/RodA/SpoVE family cell cycle protein [Clostridiales bacterium]|nr:FtsW/RodA/SpoVE family cell cycle protein [Clostridiales bacterium]
MNKNSFKEAIKETDFLLYIVCILTSAFGVLMVMSATKNSAEKQELTISRECLIMIFAAAIGIIACFIISLLDYNSFVRIWPVVAAVCLLLVLALFIWGEAPADRPDAKCWLPILKIGSTTVNFQPSELAKVGFLITFAFHINKVRRDINKIKNVALLVLHALVPIGLIILTDDLGSAIVFGLMMVGMLSAAGLKWWYFAMALAAFAAAAPLVWTKFLSGFHRQRVLAIYYPSALSETVYKNVIYQQQRCVNAIGSGGLTGDGLFKGTYTQSAAGVPVNESDMVFSVVGEELGFIGAIGLLAVMAFIAVRIAATGKRSLNLTGSLICYGTAFMIAGQTILNIGMCLKLLPCIGITLPFVSAGGSSCLCVYLAIGMCMSVYRFNKSKEINSLSLMNITTPFVEV